MASKLSKSELEQIQNTLSLNETYRFIKNKLNQSFSVGDILIKRINRSWVGFPEWEVETVSDVNPMPRRYMYVYEDPETGIGFIKQIKVSDGKLGSTLMCMTQFDYEFVKFEVDPLFVESILLGDGSFDIKDIARIEKERKGEIVAYNKSICQPSKTVSQVNAFLSQCKPGSKFYCAYGSDGYFGAWVETFEVSDWKRRFVSNLSTAVKESYSHYIDDVKVCDTKAIIMVDRKTQWGKDHFPSFYFIDKHLYLSEPKNLFSRNDR